MNLTANQLITDALKDLRVLGVGRSLAPEDAATALRYLQELIDSWAADRFTIYTVARSSYVLTANQESRTIGPTGNFVQARPIFLSSATIKEVGEDLELGIDVWDRDRWLNEPLKTQTTTVPLAVYMEPTYPDATLHFWPVPTTACTLVIGTPTAVTGFANLTTTYAFPPAYGEAFRACLVRKLARPFGRQLTQDIIDDAEDALARVKRINKSDDSKYASVDPALTAGSGGQFDIRTGEYRR